MVDNILNVSNEVDILEVKHLDVLELQALYDAIIENMKVVDGLFGYSFKY